MCGSSLFRVTLSVLTKKLRKMFEIFGIEKHVTDATLHV